MWLVAVRHQSALRPACIRILCIAAALLVAHALTAADPASQSPLQRLQRLPRIANQPTPANPRAPAERTASAEEGPIAPVPESPDDAEPAKLPDAESAAKPAARREFTKVEPTNVFGTAFNESAPQPNPAVQTAICDGVQPGKTTTNELVQQWGDGRVVSAENNKVVRAYQHNPYPKVDVTIEDDVVQSVVIHLAKPVPVDSLTKQFSISEIRAVAVPDENGEPLGQAYPERGVLFTFAPGGVQVLHVSLERPDFDSFVLRAEMHLATEIRSAYTDLDYVLSKQPQNARAMWLSARLLCGLARYDEALKAAEAAIDVDADQPLYRLTRGEILGRLSRYDDGARQTQEVLDMPGVDADLRTQVLCQLGDLIAQSPAHDYKLAIEQHMAAIKIAEPLTNDKRASVRRAAKMALVDENLAVANDIACGVYQQKEQVIGKWLDRASVAVEDLIKKEDADPALRIHLARGVLTACAALHGKIDSAPWARLALKQGKQSIATATDTWRKHQLEWELGLALSDGLTADEANGATQHVLTNSTLTATYLEEGAKARADNAEDIFRLGRLYYRVGSLHVSLRSDHKTAVTWFEKALPLLDRPIPPTQHALQGEYAHWLISMGHTYWETGNRDLAVQLTDAGVQHMEEAVKQKFADPKSLGVPYSNLAAMHQAMGHTEEARNYDVMAAKFEQPSSKR